MTLEHYKVGQLPTLYLIPDFIAEHTEHHVLNEVHSSKARWQHVSGRRLQVLGGSVTSKGLVKAPVPRWAEGLITKISAFTGVFDGAANHVLVNSYQPGEGIMPHEDGPLYHPAVAILSLGSPAVLRFWGKRGTCEDDSEDTAAECQAGDREQAQQPPSRAPQGPALLASVVCQPRSLVVFRDAAYTDCLHGIDFTAEEAVDGSVVNAEQCGLRQGDTLARSGVRTSLTVRRVLREVRGVSIRL